MKCYTDIMVTLPVPFRFVAILGHERADRQMLPEEFVTRCVVKGQVHELVAVNSESFDGTKYQGAHYLGFVEYLQSGILFREQQVMVCNQLIGTIVGFDMRHAPNHMNILVSMNPVLDGHSLHLKPGSIGLFCKKGNS